MSTSKQLALDGGIPVRDKEKQPWPKWPIYDEQEEKALLEVLHSGKWWYVEGSQGKIFEEEFAAFQDAKYAVACTNGSAAIEIALRALGVGCGDEVIVPPYTFIATASAVLSVSATPVFVDIQGDTLNIDPELIEAAITPRTKAIIPVHIAGRPAEMDRILEIARKHKLFVIEDAAQSIAAVWNGVKVGSIGDLGTFSLQASKNLNAGEGGLIVSNNEEYADAAWSVTHVGRVRSGRWYEHRVLGSNFRMTEFQAAIARTQLKRLTAQTEKRTENANYIRSQISGISGIELPKEDPRITTHANHIFTFRYNPEGFGGKSYPDFVKALVAEGVPSSTGYVPLYKEALFNRVENKSGAWCQTGRKVEYSKLSLPVCEAVCQDTVWISHILLLGSKVDADTVVEAITKIKSVWG